jgi:protein PhnA
MTSRGARRGNVGSEASAEDASTLTFRPGYSNRCRTMAKGREEHDARTARLQSFGKDLARRAKSKCELCERAGEKLSIFEVPPEPREPDIDRCLLLCERCREQADGLKRFQPGEHWRILAEMAWSGIPMVQVMAVRLLRRQAGAQAWAREALETLDLDEDLEKLVTEAA